MASKLEATSVNKSFYNKKNLLGCTQLHIGAYLKILGVTQLFRAKYVDECFQQENFFHWRPLVLFLHKQHLKKSSVNLIWLLGSLITWFTSILFLNNSFQFPTKFNLISSSIDLAKASSCLTVYFVVHLLCNFVQGEFTPFYKFCRAIFPWKSCTLLVKQFQAIIGCLKSNHRKNTQFFERLP